MSTTPALPKFCPDCGHEFEFKIGLCGHRFLQAIALQSARVGVEIECRHCKNMFVLARTESLPRINTEKGRTEKGKMNRGQQIPEQDAWVEADHEWT